MEVGMSLNASSLVRLPLSSSRLIHLNDDASSLVRHSLFSTSRSRTTKYHNTNNKEEKKLHGGHVLVVEAKGKKGMMARQYQRPPPPLPKIVDDGNP